MIDNRKVLAVVCLERATAETRRAHSRSLDGKPVLVWTLEAVRQSRLTDRFCLATDCTEIAAWAESLGCPAPFGGPEEEEGASAGRRAALSALHVLSRADQFDFVVAIDANAPLLKACDIDGCIQVSATRGGLPTTTVTETHLSLEQLYTLNDERRMTGVLIDHEGELAGGQQPRLYMTTDSIFVASRDYLAINHSFITSDTQAYILPKERSLRVVSKTDIIIAEGFLRRAEAAIGTSRSPLNLNLA